MIIDCHMHIVLEKIIDSTYNRIIQLEKQNNLSYDTLFSKRNITQAIIEKKKHGKIPVFAEIKPASPTQHLLNISTDDAINIAQNMQKAGAVAISVLTEPYFFHGCIDNLKAVRSAVNLPILRKDFILDEKQFDETPCDIILLIAGILGNKLQSFVELALEKNIEPLVEIHDENELHTTFKTSAKLIGINNRNLQTMTVDLKTTQTLAPLIRKYDKENSTEHFIVSESGIHSTDDELLVLNSGADAILVGTSIIKSGNIYKKTRQLVELKI